MIRAAVQGSCRSAASCGANLLGLAQHRAGFGEIDHEVAVVAVVEQVVADRADAAARGVGAVRVVDTAGGPGVVCVGEVYDHSHAAHNITCDSARQVGLA